MVLTRPELELKRRAPLAGGQPGTHEFIRAATVVVGFSDTCDFICTGVADDVEIQAAVDFVDALGGGLIYIEEGDYDISVAIDLEDNISLFGAGYNTHLNSTGVTGTAASNVIRVLGTAGVHKVNVLVAYVRLTGNVASYDGIGFFYADYCAVHHIWGIDVGQEEGVRYQNCTYCSVTDSYFYGGWQDSDGIKLHTSEYCVVAGNRCEYMGKGAFPTTASGIELEDSLHCTVVGNVCEGCAESGILLEGTTTHSIVSGNTSTDNLITGISVTPNAIENTVTGNTCEGNTANNMWIAAENTVITGNTANNSTNASGIAVIGDYCVVVGNNCKDNTLHGIDLNPSSYSTISGNICQDNTLRGIFVRSTSSYDSVLGNICTGNGNRGLEEEGTPDYNIYLGNVLVLNGVAPIFVGLNSVVGRNTFDAIPGIPEGVGCLTKVYPFIQGTTFISAADNPWGWEIDVADDFAIALGHLPSELQFVIRIKVWAVGLVAPGADNYMRAQFTGEAAISDEVYTTEPIDVVDKNNVEVNFGVNDVIHWTLVAADDPDIGQLVGGDSLQFKVLHEGGEGDDIATDAIFRYIEIEYV